MNKKLLFKNNYFNFSEFDDKYLISNDFGKFLFIDKSDFNSLTNHNYDMIGQDLINKLENNYFIYKDKDIFIEKISKTNNLKSYLNEGTQLHIFVLTTYCNMNCIYCQASTKNDINKCKDDKKFMTTEVAKKAVDIAFQSPSMNLTFEFQGGEPLANFEVLKYIVEYTNERNKEYGKNICYSLVSNLTLLNDDIAHFLINNGVGISTSIDGHEELHNINRNLINHNSFKETTDSIKHIRKIAHNDNMVQAIQTTSKFSIKYPKEIVDTYISLGMNSVFLRPLTPMGYAAKYWPKIGYTEEEYLNFYDKALNYIIEKAVNGTNISEGYAKIFLNKMIGNNDLNYMELRSPCGGAIGQLAYNYDGSIYTCDEGRMLSEMGDDSFKLGDVFSSNLKQLIKSPVCKTVAIASCMEVIPGCEQCIYRPYCGVCPVCNYEQFNDIFAPSVGTYRCKIYSGIMKILFEKIKENDPKIMKLFYEWAK